MKRTARLSALLLALALAVGLSVPALAAEEQGNKIVIIHTNDVHCGVEDNLGYAALVAYQKEMEARYGADYVTLIDAGDAIQGGNIGTVSKGGYLVDIMNQAGYDLAVPGNHEYDYGMDTFLTLAEERAEYSYISCNFVDLRAGETVFEPYKLVDYGAAQVAYIGITTPSTFTSSTPAYFQDGEGSYIYSFCEGDEGQDLYAAVQEAVDAARAEGADCVVAVGHLGEEGSQEKWKSSTVIANTTGIDVFIDAHSHEAYQQQVPNKDGETVYLAQTGTKLANIGQVVIDLEAGTIEARLVQPEARDEEMSAYIASINERFEAEMSQVVAASEVELTTLDENGARLVRNGETNLGDLCADAFRVVLDADIGMMNGGGIRADIAAGEVTMGDILSVYTFGNEACLAQVAGQQILDALEMGVRNYPGESGGFQHVSGLAYAIDASIPSGVVTDEQGSFAGVEGDYRVTDVMVDGEPLDLEKTYTVASHGYMLKNGGDGFSMFSAGDLLLDSVMVDNALLAQYITEDLGGVITEEQYGESAGRITVKYAGVDGSAWYAPAVKMAMDAGRMADNGGFDPAAPVTEAQAAAALYGAPVEGTGTEPITRARMAGLAADFAVERGVAAEADTAALEDAPDQADIPAEALEDMAFCRAAGIMVGDQGGRMNPNQLLTRAELAQILWNLSRIPVPLMEEAA